MRRMWLRAALIAVLVVSIAAGFYAFLTGQRIAQARQAERAFDARAWGVLLSLAELRAAQQAYVATGQDRDYWVAEVAARTEQVTADLASLSSTSTLPPRPLRSTRRPPCWRRCCAWTSRPATTQRPARS